MRFSRTRIIQGAQARTQRHYKAQYKCTFDTFPLPIKVQKVVSVSKPKVGSIYASMKKKKTLTVISHWSLDLKPKGVSATQSTMISLQLGLSWS